MANRNVRRMDEVEGEGVKDSNETGASLHLLNVGQQRSVLPVDSATVDYMLPMHVDVRCVVGVESLRLVQLVVSLSKCA